MLLSFFVWPSSQGTVASASGSEAPGPFRQGAGVIRRKGGKYGTASRSRSLFSMSQRSCLQVLLFNATGAMPTLQNTSRYADNPTTARRA